MRIKVQTQQAFVLRQVVELIRQQLEQENESYSSSIELGLTELVQDSMRSIALEWKGPLEVNLLGQGTLQARRQVEGWLNEDGLEFDLEPYLESVRKTLKYPTREMAQLSRQLWRSRETQRLGKRQEKISADYIRFEVIEMGLSQMIDGLVVAPLVEECELDLDAIESPYQLEGEWFPFEITVRELQVVLDDDGSLVLSTRNFPEFLLLEAKTIVITLAERLYTIPAAP